MAYTEEVVRLRKGLEGHTVSLTPVTCFGYARNGAPGCGVPLVPPLFLSPLPSIRPVPRHLPTGSLGGLTILYRSQDPREYSYSLLTKIPFPPYPHAPWTLQLDSTPHPLLEGRGGRGRQSGHSPFCSSTSSNGLRGSVALRVGRVPAGRYAGPRLQGGEVQTSWSVPNWVARQGETRYRESRDSEFDPVGVWDV